MVRSAKTTVLQMVKQAVYRLEPSPKEPKGSSLHQINTFVLANYAVNKQTYKVSIQKVLKQMMEIGEVQKSRNNYRLGTSYYEQMYKHDPGTFDPDEEERARREKREAEQAEIQAERDRRAALKNQEKAKKHEAAALAARYPIDDIDLENRYDRKRKICGERPTGPKPACHPRGLPELDHETFGWLLNVWQVGATYHQLLELPYELTLEQWIAGLQDRGGAARYTDEVQSKILTEP